MSLLAAAQNTVALFVGLELLGRIRFLLDSDILVGLWVTQLQQTESTFLYTHLRSTE